MIPLNKQAADALSNAKIALKNGDKSSARFWARKAAVLAPGNEEPWLLLAAVGSPRASLAYLQKALENNPSSTRARRGMHWAVQRYRNSSTNLQPRRPLIHAPIAPAAFTRVKPAPLPWVILFFVLVLVFLGWVYKPSIQSLASSPSNALAFSGARLVKSSSTPTPTNTPTASLTPTSTPSPTPSLTLTFTETPAPTEMPSPTPGEEKTQNITLPDIVEKGQRWIDIDLTNQRIYAYQGKNLHNSFIVSTGTWQYPTITGQYRIYVKYTYADMAGPGYYLPNVPYVMYFYKGYGIHGTYWHNNFGTPMSHGCINLKTEDAGWIFNWSSIGTVVNIHY